MPALLIGLIFIIGIPLAVIGFIYTVHFLYFLINVVGTLDFAPAFFHTGNVFAWVIAIIGFIIALALAKVIVKVIRFLGIILAHVIAMAVLAIIDKGKSDTERVKTATGLALLLTVLLFIVLAVIGSVYGTSQVLAFTAENPGLTGTFVSGNIIATIYLFLLGMSVLAPTNAGNKSDD